MRCRLKARMGRSRCITQSRGKPVHTGKSGSVSAQGGKAMFEDAPVNTGTVGWPDPDSAYFAVRRMQTKLHRWAIEDSGRRFGDLFNLIYDPAFLVAAWERVSTNKGAKTAGIDKATAAMIETWVGVETFLEQIRNSLKSGEFRPVEVRQVMIPKGNSGAASNGRADTLISYQ